MIEINPAPYFKYTTFNATPDDSPFQGYKLKEAIVSNSKLFQEPTSLAKMIIQVNELPDEEFVPCYGGLEVTIHKRIICKKSLFWEIIQFFPKNLIFHDDHLKKQLIDILSQDKNKKQATQYDIGINNFIECLKNGVDTIFKRSASDLKSNRKQQPCDILIVLSNAI